MSQNQQTILITGATDGIGLALANHYSSLNYRLILIGRRDLSQLDGSPPKEDLNVSHFDENETTLQNTRSEAPFHRRQKEINYAKQHCRRLFKTTVHRTTTE